MWTNDGSDPLFVVRKRKSETYYTGGYRTGSKPQMYSKGPAKAACNRLNKDHKRYYDHLVLTGTIQLSKEEWVSTNSYWSKQSEAEQNRAYENYSDQFLPEGPWIVAIVQMSATEYSE